MKFLNNVIFAAVYFCSYSFYAQNLVLNPSFETVNTSNLQCSWYTAEAQFTSAMSNWDYPTNGSTDIFHTSLATSCYGHPLSTNASSNGQQSPRTGSCMTNIVTYGSGGCTPYREYLQGQLSTALIPGTTYTISMYVSLLDLCNRGTNNIGVKFTTTRQNTGNNCVWATTPSANYTGAPITNKTGWTLVSLSYTPTGTGQQYFSIGNFYTDGATNTTSVSGTKSTIRYFIDDVSVVKSCNLVANAGPNRSLTCSNPSDPLSGSQTGGTGSISYSWSPGTSLSSTSSSTPTTSANSSINYTLLVTDGNGCTDTDVVSVSVNKTSPNANAGPNRTTTCANPTASLAGSGGGSYSWNNGAGTSATPTVNPGSTTTYQLLVTGTNGCTDTDAVLVTVNKALPNANAGPDRTTTCAIPTASLAGSGGGTYSWNNGAGTSATPSVNPGSTTTYQLLVTGSNGCTDTDAVVVTVNKASPTANAGPNRTTTCITPTASLTGSGGGSYSWSSGAGTSASPTVNPGATTNYTLTVTAANGCTDTDVATVTVDETSPNANAGPNRTTNCVTPTASLAGSGGGSYSWSNSAGTSATPTVNPTTNTTYTLTVTGANGCTDTDAAVVTVDKTVPNASAGADVTVDCATPSATLSGSGGGTYSWNNGGGTSATPTVTPSNTTVYTVTVTGSNGCADSDQVTVTVNGAVPTANAGSDFTTTCITPTATLSGSGGGTYSWNNGAGAAASTTVNPAVTTTYVLTVTAANGCTDTDAAIVTVDEASPSASAGADINLDCATTSGAFTATGGGSYSWASPNGASTVAGFPVADSDTPGNYTLTVTAANGCTDTDVATLTIDQVDPVANAGADQTSSCAVPVVSLDGSASSGVGITYSWTGPNVTGGATANTATADAPGTYTLVVTGSNSCTHSSQVDVLPDLNVPVANAGVDQVLDCNNTSVNLDGSASDASASITYSWTTTGGNITGSTIGSSTTADLDGTYTITVTNSANGCSATDAATVSQDTITPVNSVTNSSYVIDCNNPVATFDASASTGIGNTFSWTTADGNIVSGGNTDAPSVNESGTYSLSITSTNGCGNLNTTNVTVTMDTVSPTIQINIADTLTCNILQVTLDASGSQAGVTYNWSTIDGLISSGGTTATPVVSESGTYTLTVTSANGCTTTFNETVADSEVPVAHIVTNTTEGEVDLNVIFSDTSSGVGLTHYWDFGTDNMDFDTVSPTTFTYTDFQQYEAVLTITDQYGCIATDTVVINALELSAIEVPNIFTPNGDGDNDYFNVRGGGVKNMTGNILNRWGQVIYEWDSQFGGWDGYSVSGSKAAEGTYFYFISVDFNDGHSEEYTGHLMLKR